MAKAPFKIKSPLDVGGHVGINTAPDDKYELLVNGTSGIKIPAGTTAEQPSAPEVGAMRYNTSLNQFQVFRSDGWRSVAQIHAGPTVPDNTSGMKYDMYMQLSEQSSTVVDVYIHNGTRWASMLPAINQKITQVESKVDNMSFDFGEY